MRFSRGIFDCGWGRTITTRRGAHRFGIRYRVPRGAGRHHRLLRYQVAARQKLRAWLRDSRSRKLEMLMAKKRKVTNPNSGWRKGPMIASARARATWSAIARKRKQESTT